MAAFSIKRRFIWAYLLVLLFAAAIIVFNYMSYKKARQSVKTLQKTLFPLNGQINAYQFYFHLNENFTLSTLLENKDRAFFLQSLTLSKPKAFSDNIKQAFEYANKTFANNPNQVMNWSRIQRLFALLQQKHTAYQQFIYQLASHINPLKEDASDVERQAWNIEFEQNNQKLLKNKQELITRLKALSRHINLKIEKSLQDSLKQQKQLFLNMTIAAAILALFALILLKLGLDALKPLQQIKKASDHIRSGDYQLRLPKKGSIEVQSLSHSFNAMAESIQERNEKIDQQHLQILHAQKMVTIGEMTSKINHEIRNPLSAMQLNIELLLEDTSLSKDNQNKLQDLLFQIDRLNVITETYLQSSKHNPKQHQTLIDIQSFLDDIHAFFKAEFKTSNISFNANIQTSFETVRFDYSILFQSMINLIKNALDACQSKAQVGIQVCDDGDQIYFQVWNTGQAIAPTDQDKIFDAFYSNKSKGSGLGLSISKDILSNQGGHIQLDHSNSDRTQFSIRLKA